jgi:hypothetical protein
MNVCQNPTKDSKDTRGCCSRSLRKVSIKPNYRQWNLQVTNIRKCHHRHHHILIIMKFIVRSLRRTAPSSFWSTSSIVPILEIGLFPFFQTIVQIASVSLCLFKYIYNIQSSVKSEFLYYLVKPISGLKRLVCATVQKPYTQVTIKWFERSKKNIYTVLNWSLDNSGLGAGRPGLGSWQG